MGNTFKLGNYVNAIFQDASNNVGIGAAPSGSYKLEVTGTGRFTGALTSLQSNISSGSSSYGTWNGTTSGAGFLALQYNSSTYGWIGQGSAIVTSGSNTDLAISYQNNLVFSQGAGAAKMTITSAGNVGIGTISASTKLHVSGAVSGVFEGMLVENTTSSWYSLYQCKTGSSGVWQWGVWPDNGYRIGLSGVGDYLTITSGGRGLFGTTTPSAGASGFASSSFQVQGEVVSKGSLAGFFWENRSGGTTDNSNWYGWYTTTGTIYLYNGAGNIAYINTSSGAYVPLSDINKKKDFEESTIGLKEILRLKPTLYRMKSDDESKAKELGFIAQEVKDFIPQAYVESITEKDNFIGLNQMPIVAALTKAIQEQQAQIEELNERLNKAGL
jgi:hypothetical protein